MYSKIVGLLPPTPRNMDGGILIVAVIAVALKVLLLPSKQSTDFEVHRNWLAITHNLPLKEWYREAGSIWTLDYPPMFAYFEFVLAKVANFLMPGASFLNLDAYDNADTQCRFFQRGTVIVSDLLLLFAVHQKWSSATATQRVGLLLLCLLPALLIVDHIHFQYNGMLIGLLLLSVKVITDVTSRIFAFLGLISGKLILGSALFTLLVCFKHLYLVFAPILGLYVLVSIFKKPSSAWLFEFALTAYSCAKVLAISFLPFVLKQQLPQIVSRLFPTGRGLLHAYWAPNFWALYAAGDIAARHLFKHRLDWYEKISGHQNIPASFLTNGVAEEKSFSILPNISPLICLASVAVFHFPLFVKLCRNATAKNLVNCLLVSGLISFLFGYHVHEKGLIPVLALYLYFNEHFTPEAHSKMTSIMLASQFALLPLMHGWIEGAIAFILVFSSALIHAGLAESNSSKVYRKILFNILPLMVALHAKLFISKFEFAPLLAISTFYAVVISLNSLRLYKNLLLR